MGKNAKSNSVPKQKKSTASKNKVKKHEEANEDQISDPENELLEQRSFKNGQKYPTPPIGDGTRAFYESLLEENPNSQMAIKFCLEYGILPEDKHEKLHIVYNKLKDNGMLKAPIGGLTLKNNVIA